jgi:hypothetical protein
MFLFVLAKQLHFCFTIIVLVLSLLLLLFSQENIKTNPTMTSFITSATITTPATGGFGGSGSLQGIFNNCGGAYYVSLSASMEQVLVNYGYTINRESDYGFVTQAEFIDLLERLSRRLVLLASDKPSKKFSQQDVETVAIEIMQEEIDEDIEEINNSCPNDPDAAKAINILQGIKTRVLNLLPPQYVSKAVAYF